MGMDNNSKQRRKTPLTTIAISQEASTRLDEFVRQHKMTRREFVESALDYFEANHIDPRDKTITSLTPVIGKLEQIAAVMSNNNTMLSMCLP